jgi:hypothetical protein
MSTKCCAPASPPSRLFTCTDLNSVYYQPLLITLCEAGLPSPVARSDASLSRYLLIDRHRSRPHGDISGAG